MDVLSTWGNRGPERGRALPKVTQLRPFLWSILTHLLSQANLWGAGAGKGGALVPQSKWLAGGKGFGAGQGGL